MGVLAVLFSNQCPGEKPTNVRLLSIAWLQLYERPRRLSHYLYIQFIYETLCVSAHANSLVYWSSFVSTGALALLRGAQPMAWNADALEDAVSGTLHTGMDLFSLSEGCVEGGTDKDQPHAYQIRCTSHGG